MLNERGYVAELDAVIVTKDVNFSNMIAVGGETPPIVWVRVSNTRRAPLLACGGAFETYGRGRPRLYRGTRCRVAAHRHSIVG